MSAPVEIPAWVKAIALLAIFGAGITVGHSYTDAIWAKKWAERNAAESDASRVASENAREVEHNDQAVASDAAEQHRKGEQDGKATTDGTITGLHDGTVRVRERFTCPPTPPAPKADPAPSVVADPGRGGLRGSDAEFLVRFADQCDSVARELNYCKAELDRIMKVCSQ